MALTWPRAPSGAGLGGPCLRVAGVVGPHNLTACFDLNVSREAAGLNVFTGADVVVSCSGNFEIDARGMLLLGRCPTDPCIDWLSMF